MPGGVAERFERDMGCTEAEWLRWLPGAVGAAPLRVSARAALVTVGAGTLCLRWQPLPARTIALLHIARLHVSFAFEGVEPAQREAFIRRFDLFTQRGGG